MMGDISGGGEERGMGYLGWGEERETKRSAGGAYEVFVGLSSLLAVLNRLR